MTKEKVQSALLGLAIGDALGVPVEFKSRKYLKQNPVTDLFGEGTHYQPLGTFSDDASMAFCLAENLVYGYSIAGIANNFVKWYQEGFWSARGEVFDIGIGTRRALERIINGGDPLEAGGKDESSNGNGSLMRILPLLFYIYEMPLEKRFQITTDVSSITHVHIRSVISCFYYLEFARLIFNGKNLQEAYDILRENFPQNLKILDVPDDEILKLGRLFTSNFKHLSEDQIYSSGYVLHTLEASIWCLLNTDSYKDAVLKAVNLGDDTDTTGSVTGGLAGMFYGLAGIPKNWQNSVAGRDGILNLAKRLADRQFILSKDSNLFGKK